MSIQSKILVSLQFFCITYFIFFTDFLGQGWILFLQITGFLLSLWAVIIMKPGRFNIQPEIKPNATFIRLGPYRLIRNPMYAGLIIVFGCSTLNNYKIIEILIFMMLVGVLVIKIQLEEKYLSELFGEDYLNYKKRTHRLIPFIY